jgi:hypothetical protein
VGVISRQITYPGVSERDCEMCDANTAIVVWHVPNGASSVEFKFETTADSDSQVVGLMVAAGASGKQYDRYGRAQTDDYEFGGSLALTGGTQVGRNSNVYVDTVTVSDANGLLDMDPVDSAHNRVCVVRADSWGYKEIAFLCTTAASNTTIYVYCRWSS